jgi:hypothetical protein
MAGTSNDPVEAQRKRSDQKQYNAGGKPALVHSRETGDRHRMSAIGEDGPATRGDKGELQMDGAAPCQAGDRGLHATDHQ